MALADTIIGLESGNNPNATNPRSSAAGLGQFIDGTWLSMIGKYHPELASLPKQEILGLRSDPGLSKEMTAAYAKENSDYLAQKGLPVTAGTAYLAHFAGPAGAAKVLSSDPNAPVSEVLGPAVVKANPFLKDMKVSDLTAWADKKMGTAPAMPTPGAPAAPTLGAPQPPQAQPQQQPAPQATPQAQPLPAYAFSSPQDLQQQIAQYQMQAPTLNAPQIHYEPPRFNVNALAKIPVPAGFKGYSI